jgi:drug/metabolite transporter (DMT)-like permease
MDTRKAIDGQAIVVMVVLCATWGMQQVALKAKAADIAPVMQIGLRSGIAACLVALVMHLRGELIDYRLGDKER